jgi:hypothetical protein
VAQANQPGLQVALQAPESLVQGLLTQNKPAHPPYRQLPAWCMCELIQVSAKELPPVKKNKSKN